MSKVKVTHITNIDSATGEVIGHSKAVEVAPKSIGYDTWIAKNQKGDKTMLSSKNKKEKDLGLYTVKGKLFMYLVNNCGANNFVDFNAKHIALQLQVTVQAVYKYKKQLIKDGLIVEAYRRNTGTKGVVIDPDLYQNGLRGNNDIVIVTNRITGEEGGKNEKGTN